MVIGVWIYRYRSVPAGVTGQRILEVIGDFPRDTGY